MIPIKDNIPTDRFPFVTLVLIITNFVVYYLAVRHGGSIIGGPDAHEVLKYGAIPYSLTHPGAPATPGSRWPAPRSGLLQRTALPDGTIAHLSGQNTLPSWETIFTSMFMHGSILHIAGNMLFLWIFGNNVEDSMGPDPLRRSSTSLADSRRSPSRSSWPQIRQRPTIGASGAIAAVLGGYIVLYPRARVLTLVFIVLFFTVIELPAVVMLGIWFAEQAVFGATEPDQPNRRRRRRGVLRARRRVRVRPGGDPPARHQAQTDPAPAPGLLIGVRSSRPHDRAGVHREPGRADGVGLRPTTG